MKLNKVKIARLTDDQAKSVNGGGSDISTHNGFTCCWCSQGENTYFCATQGENTCHPCQPPIG